MNNRLLTIGLTYHYYNRKNCNFTFDEWLKAKEYIKTVSQIIIDEFRVKHGFVSLSDSEVRGFK